MAARTPLLLINDVEDLLQHHKLTKECACKKCPENFLKTKVAGIIIDWKALAPHLGMTDADEVAIKEDGKNEEGRRRELLQRWLQRNGSEATYYKLIEAFIEANHKNTADKICKHLADEAKEECSQLKKVKVSEKDTEVVEMDGDADITSMQRNETLDDQTQPAANLKEDKAVMPRDCPPRSGRNIEAEFTEKFSSCMADDLNIAVIGVTGSGKSSLINILCRGDVAEVEDGAAPCPHKEYIKEHLLRYGNITMHVFDTRGLSDPKVSAKKIFGSIRKELKAIDLLLICHKLYSKVDKSAYEVGEKLKQYCASEMFDHAVIVLTQADEYKVHNKSYLEDGGEEKVRKEFIARIGSVTEELQAMLVDHHKLITKHQFLTIPVCVSSRYMKDLPATDNWEDNLWNNMAKRCTEKAAPLLGFLARNKQKILIVSGTGVGSAAGAAVGAAIGAVAGTAIVPGVGTVIGAVGGGTIAGIIVIGTALATKKAVK